MFYPSNGIDERSLVVFSKSACIVLFKSTRIYPCAGLDAATARGTPAACARPSAPRARPSGRADRQIFRLVRVVRMLTELRESVWALTTRTTKFIQALRRTAAIL